MTTKRKSGKTIGTTSTGKPIIDSRSDSFKRKVNSRSIKEITDPEIQDMVKNSLIDDMREPRRFRLVQRLPIIGQTQEWLTSEELKARMPQMAMVILYTLDRVGDSFEYKCPTTDFEIYVRRLK